MPIFPLQPKSFVKRAGDTVKGTVNNIIPEQTITISQLKGGDFKTLQEAIQFAETKATSTYRQNITLDAQTYEEELTLSKGYATIKGQGHQHTTIKRTSVTNGLLNIGTGCNNSTIEFEGITFEMGVDDQKIINCLASEVTIYFTNCRFYSPTTGSYVRIWETLVNSSNNKVYFVSCIFEGDSTRRLRLCKHGNDPSTRNEVITVKNSIFKGTSIGIFGGNMKMLVIGCTQEVAAEQPINPRDSAFLELVGGTWGSQSNTASSALISTSSAGVNIKIVGALLQHGQNAPILLHFFGTSYIEGCEFLGGSSAFEFYYGTSNLKNTSFVKHSSGAGYDIYNHDVGGTLNATFIKFTTKSGVINKADEDVDKIDGAHASATPTASTIPIADGGGKLDGWITPSGGVNVLTYLGL